MLVLEGQVCRRRRFKAYSQSPQPALLGKKQNRQCHGGGSHCKPDGKKRDEGNAISLCLGARKEIVIQNSDFGLKSSGLVEG
jgi:hypothetical protein